MFSTQWFVQIIDVTCLPNGASEVSDFSTPGVWVAVRIPLWYSQQMFLFSKCKVDSGGDYLSHKIITRVIVCHCFIHWFAVCGYSYIYVSVISYHFRLYFAVYLNEICHSNMNFLAQQFLITWFSHNCYYVSSFITEQPYVSSQLTSELHKKVLEHII